MDKDKAAQIRALNDRFRQSGLGGTILHTNGVHALGAEIMNELVTAIIGFDDFDSGNDPYGEHDFGAVTVEENRVFWKIDYCGLDMVSGSPDPANPKITNRVMTIMLASEY